MPSDPTILAFDTSAAHCAAALLSGDQIVALRVDAMARGQVEHLMPLLTDLLAEAGRGWDDLDAIAVGTGPGNFTGTRISVSAARGLALALEVPAIGISTLEALSEGRRGLCTVPAPRDQHYAQNLDDGAPLSAPRLEPGAVPPPDPQSWLPALARLAARRLGSEQPAPAPLYLRPADAAPAADPPPVILS